MDSNPGDLAELNNSLNEVNNMISGLPDTSDLGNSIQSSLMSKDGNGEKDKHNAAECHFLNIPNR